MRSVTWTSTAPIASAVEPDSSPAVDLEGLYSRWEAASNKGRFMDRLTLTEAAALVSLAKDRMPPLPIIPRAQRLASQGNRSRSRRKQPTS